MPDLEDYDTIFLGYPVWNADLPFAMYAFLENNVLDGKTIIPFDTHGGSGLGRTIQTIKQLQLNAQVLEDGLAISRNDAANAAGSVTRWLNTLEITKWVDHRVVIQRCEKSASPS